MKNIIMIYNILIKLEIILTDFVFSLLINNISSIVISESKKIIQNIRHVNIYYYHIRNFIQNDMIKILYIISRDMIADELTKTLNIIKFKEFYDFIKLLKKDLNINKNNNDSFNNDFDN